MAGMQTPDRARVPRPPNFPRTDTVLKKHTHPHLDAPDAVAVVELCALGEQEQGPAACEEVGARPGGIRGLHILAEHQEGGALGLEEVTHPAGVGVGCLGSLFMCVWGGVTRWCVVVAAGACLHMGSRPEVGAHEFRPNHGQVEWSQDVAAGTHLTKSKYEGM